jgi:cardiolipin synthase
VSAPPSAGRWRWLAQFAERLSARALPRNPADSDTRHHAALLQRAIGQPACDGNQVEVLIDGAATHRAMFDAVAGATDHVNIESYILEDAGPGTELHALLLERRRAGVAINVIYDAWGSWTTRAAYFASLRAAGVRLLEFNPINPLRHPLRWTVHLRNHRKLLVVDGRVAFIGGVNISSVYSSGGAGSGTAAARGAPTRWRDTHLRIEGPVVAQLQRLYLAHWRDRAGSPAQAAGYFPPLAPAGAQAVTVAACTAGRDRNPLYHALIAAIRGAKSRVWITSAYFVPTRRLTRALLAAAQRGVDVRLALPGISDQWAALAAGRSLYGRLLGAGVRIYERHDAILHAKTAVIDGVWVTVGSSNMDWRSLLHNAEANVVVVDRALGERFEWLFAQDAAASRELTLQQWLDRGWAPRAAEWLARKFEYLL